MGPAGTGAAGTGVAGPGASRPTCYVASPLGFSEAGTHWYRQVLLPLLARHVEVHDPWVSPTGADIAAATAEDRLEAFWLEVGRTNFAAVDAADLLVAILDGEPPDIGTVAELAWAARAGKPIVAYRSDVRQSGEEAVPVNLMVPAAVASVGGFWVSSLVELEDAVRTAAGRGLAAPARDDPV